MTDIPLTADAERWLARARESINLDASPWEGDTLQATINRDLLNRVVAAEQQAIAEVAAELDGPFVGLLGQERPG